MKKIDLQGKTEVTTGTIESYWFENPNIGLIRTLFHRIAIPLMPFNSGLNYVEQPEETELVFDWIELPTEELWHNKTTSLNTDANSRMEVSIYVGAAHNPCQTSKLELSRLTETNFQLKGEVEINFEAEGVAQNELFNFQAELAWTKT